MAWRTRTQGRPLSQRLDALPSAPFTPDEREAWDEAVRYYDRELASKDLLSGEGMTAIKTALVGAGNWAWGYATSNPTHATISSTHPTTQGWEAVETVFHEYSHILVDGLFRTLNAALGDGVKQHPVLWHAVQFHLTGEAVREALARRNISYEPSVEELFERAWPHYRQPVKEAWGPYLGGRATMDDAIARTVAALHAPK